MQVIELARRLQVSTDTVRYYTKVGFLQPVKSTANGYRHYSERDLERLRFILSARQLGFSVADVGQILAEADAGHSPCPLVRDLIEQRLHETEQRFRETRLLRDRMHAALEEWRLEPDGMPDGHSICHLIEGFMPADTVPEQDAAGHSRGGVGHR